MPQRQVLNVTDGSGLAGEEDDAPLYFYAITFALWNRGLRFLRDRQGDAVVLGRHRALCGRKKSALRIITGHCSRGCGSLANGPTKVARAREIKGR